MYLNQLTIIGFTGQDAEVHYTTNGTLVTTLSVATKESWKNGAGQWQSRTEWHRVLCFGDKLAEYARTVGRGSHLIIQGSVRTANSRKTVSNSAFSNYAPTPSANWTVPSVMTLANLILKWTESRCPQGACHVRAP